MILQDRAATGRNFEKPIPSGQYPAKLSEQVL
jgi:hypothetical protein